MGLRTSSGRFAHGVLSSPNPIKPGERRGVSTEFKPGTRPLNWVPVGTVRIRKRKRKGDKPRAWVKIAEPKTWIPRAQLVWIEANGPIPEGCVIHHKNHDTLDDAIENLQMMTAKDHNDLHDVDRIEGRKGAVWTEKNVVCVKCQSAYTAKVQRKNSLCGPCAKKSNDEAKRRYKERNSK